MKIEIEQIAYSSGVVEFSCKLYSVCESGMKWREYTLFVSKINSSYTISIDKNGRAQDFTMFLPDFVEDSKNLSDLDWQLLKITNPDVEPYQWQIFKLLKKLIDNKSDESYTVSEIKEVLNKYEI